MKIQNKLPDEDSTSTAPTPTTITAPTDNLVLSVSVVMSETVFGMLKIESECLEYKTNLKINFHLL